jgi:undecaprenyl-diphosphatase
MLSLFQAIVLGLVQGITELFPISSLGHSILIPAIFGWHVDQNANFFLMFLVATHFATALVLFIIYRRDWLEILRGMGRSLAAREIKEPSAKLGWLLVVATIPAGIAGVLFETQVQNLFSSPRTVAIFLALNAVLLLIAESLRRRNIKEADASNTRISEHLSWWQSIKIGALQVVSLLPGFSRTGSTLAGGLISGLSHEDALRFSFLLATPIIAAAAILKLPELAASGNGQAIETAIVGAIAAGAAAYVAAKFLVRYFKTKTLTPFAIYCLTAGVLCFLFLK